MALALVAGVMEARGSGKGRDVDVSLYDVGLANLNYMAAWSANEGYQPQRLARSGHPTLVPCQLFTTQDGWIYIMANKEKFFPILLRSLGCPELADAPRFRSFADSAAYRVELSDRLDAAFATRPTAEWLKLLNGRVPAAPVATMADALASDFTAERGKMVDCTAEAGATISLIGSPFRGGKPVPPRPAPRLGADTDDLLAEAGYDAARISDLRARGVVV